MLRIWRKTWTKYMVLTGVTFLNFFGGFSVFYGNLYAYVESYFHVRLSPGRSDLAPEWVLSTCLIVLPIGNLVADFLKYRLGLRLSVFMGLVLYSMGFFLSTLAVMNSVWATALTFGAIGIFGLGILEMMSYCYTSAWFPHHQGLAGSTVCASGSVGAIVFNSVITGYVNPRNLKADSREGDMAYFSQPEILDRIPVVFVILGSLNLGFQFLGFLMLKSPDVGINELNENGNIYKTNSKQIKTAYKSSEKSHLGLSNGQVDKEKKYIMNGSVPGGNKEKKKIEISLPERSVNISMDVSPKEMLKSGTFWLLWFSLMAMSLGLTVVSNYYKFFAQVWISNDTFLTIMANTSAISSTIVRILLGYFIDKFRAKTVFIGIVSTTSVLLSFWYFTAMLNRWAYFLCTNLLAGLTSAILLLYPLASIKFYGMKHFATNTGLISLAMTASDFVSAPIMSALIMHYGWFWLFFTVAALIALSLFSIILFMTRKQVL